MSSPRSLRSIGIVGLGSVAIVAVLASLAIGTKSIPLSEVIDSFTSYNPKVTNHLVVHELRLPRTIVAGLVGIALGAAGALMQAVTRNPLADPGILGVNAGAAFAVVLAIWMLGVSGVSQLIWFALIGAAIASVVVYALGSIGRGGATPVRLALAGTALSALLFALTRAVTLIDEATLDQFRFWAVGSLSGRNSEVAWAVLPFVVVGVVMAIGVSRSLNAIGLGEEAAAGLGVRVSLVRSVAGVAIMLLCGAAVAAVGPIGFVGLVMPHVVRSFFGPDQRWIVPASALAGAGFLLLSDTLGRVIARPSEVQVGIMTAVIGGPAFVALVRKVRMVQL
ncbi:MAG: Fe(3+)-siderophore ABC transporter permease [Ilumatobacter coccineus]|uniref:Fe(3+)-siderophore ABC transporter permease n=1 Tax=Ilumatobacter coccineus TaxID=467094 RepID=A0A2G6K6J7_9ACTN|nr:MAG: Fe(3+)-siderophore ABC transporter permease [Ilumatobacter coccineus]